MTAESEDLVAAAQQRDRAAMEELIKRYLPGLRTFVRLRVDHSLRAKESCSDLVQSACMEALEHLGQFEYRGEDSFRNWLFTTALNKIRSRREYWQADKRDPAHEAALPAADASSQLADGYASLRSPLDAVIGHEFALRLEAAFDRMPEQYREVLTLSRVLGLSNAQIAVELGKSDGAVRTLLSRALVRLSALLDETPA
jgi:RNA polymerase sigma-70 factor (ECF subfamily)